MKIIFYIATFLYIWTPSSANVIKFDKTNPNKSGINHKFESYNSELNSSQLISNLIFSMLHQPQIAYSRNYRKAKVSSDYQNPEDVLNCEHYITPNICPICIFRMRKSVPFQIPNDKEILDHFRRSVNNTAIISEAATTRNTINLEHIKETPIYRKTRGLNKIDMGGKLNASNNKEILYKDSHNYKSNFNEKKGLIGSEMESINNNMTNSVNDLKSPLDRRIQIHNIKSFEETSNNPKLSDIFQKLFANSWKTKSADEKYNILKKRDATTESGDGEEQTTTAGNKSETNSGRDSSGEVRIEMQKMFLSITLPTVIILGSAILFSCYLFRLNGFICKMFSGPIDSEEDLVEITEINIATPHAGKQEHIGDQNTIRSDVVK